MTMTDQSKWHADHDAAIAADIRPGHSWGSKTITIYRDCANTPWQVQTKWAVEESLWMDDASHHYIYGVPYVVFTRVVADQPEAAKVFADWREAFRSGGYKALAAAAR